jgi:protein TonB
MKKICLIGIVLIFALFLPIMLSCEGKTQEDEVKTLVPEEKQTIEEDQFKEEPLIAGVDDVTYPERVAESYVKPEYPENARKEKIEGLVILQIIVKKDGAVGGTTVLRSPDPDLGFEEAAIKAVEQWKYKPAMKNDQPVDVYLTVQVSFELT